MRISQCEEIKSIAAIKETVCMLASHTRSMQWPSPNLIYCRLSDSSWTQVTPANLNGYQRDIGKYQKKHFVSSWWSRWWPFAASKNRLRETRQTWMQFPIVPPTTSRESLAALPTWWCGLSLGVSFQHPLGIHHLVRVRCHRCPVSSTLTIQLTLLVLMAQVVWSPAQWDSDLADC